jgi:hypothetical protein
MILIADSGSTKTDWCVVDEHQVIKKIKTKGINPFFQTEDEIAKEIHASLIPQLPETAISNVYFLWCRLYSGKDIYPGKWPEEISADNGYL